MRFFERILGALTQPPISVEAAVQIPLGAHDSTRPSTKQRRRQTERDHTQYR